MEIQLMRRLDKWLGIPACMTLTQFEFLRAAFRRHAPSPVRRLLFVKLAEQGATVLAYPTLRAAVDRLGAQNVFFLVFDENRFILDALGIIPEQNVIVIRTRSLASLLASTVSAISKIRQLKIDASIDMEFFARSSAVLSYLSGASVRVGFHAFAADFGYRGNLMTHRLSYNPYLHIMQTYRLMLSAIDRSADSFPAFGELAPTLDRELPLLKFGDEQMSKVRQSLAQASLTDSPLPLILLNANASDLIPLRRWPSERYVVMARMLLYRFPELHIAFTGAPAEVEPVDELVRQVGSTRCFSMAGRTTITQLLILYGLAEILVTNDSGPAHFATLTPVDVITLFGPETPDLFGSPSLRNHSLYAKLACSPCVNAFNNRLSSCRDNQCMKMITVDEVFHTVVRCYESRRAISTGGDSI